jgi:hypothetical protein
MSDQDQFGRPDFWMPPEEYKPHVSVEWDGEKAHSYQHEERKFTPPAKQIAALVLEWTYYYLRFGFLVAYRWPLRLGKLAYRKLLQQPTKPDQWT